MRIGGKSLYIATMPPRGSDACRRIERHRSLRAGKGFDTLEYYGDLASLLLPQGKLYDNILLECVGNVAANTLFGRDIPLAEAAENLLEGVRYLRGQAKCLVVVSGDVFSDGIKYDENTSAYIGCMSAVGRRLASEAGVVIEMVCGLPVYHKRRPLKIMRG